MKKFILSLNKKPQRPIVYLNDWHGIDAMIDTGSLFPVWVADESILDMLGAKRIRDDVGVSGFGGTVKGSLYVIPLFQFGELMYPHFHIVTHKLDLPCQMILPATMFRNLQYEIDDKNHLFQVTIPDEQSNIRNLVISDKAGKLHVLCTSAEDAVGGI